MSAPTSPETVLLEGLAQMVADAGIGVYSERSPYASSDVGIVFGDLAVDPTQQIVLTTYTVSDDPLLNESILAVQVMLRGTSDPRSVKDRSGAIFDLFQGLQDVSFGSPTAIHVALMWRQSGRLDGKDEENRWLSSENYYARCNWPTQYRAE